VAVLRDPATPAGVGQFAAGPRLLSTKQLIGTLFAVIAAAGTPTLAQRSDAGMAWEHAARNCNAEMQKVIQPIWGESEVDSYRTCMTRQGFKE